MKFNISCPLTGAQKCLDIDDEKKFHIFYDKRMGQEVEIDQLGDEFKGYVAKITGGNDKDGFTMKQGVLVKGRVRLLMGKGSKNYRPRRTGERKRKSVRGCIVGPDIRVLAIAIVKKGENHIPGLTNETIARKRGPKRVTRIRKLFNLKKEDDVRNFVVRRKIEKEGKKTRVKAPKIQRLVTEKRLRRKRMWKKEKLERISRRKKQLDDFHKVLVEYKKQKIASRKAAQEEVKKPEAPVKKEAPKTDPKKTEKKPVTTTQPSKKKEEPKKTSTNHTKRSPKN